MSSKMSKRQQRSFTSKPTSSLPSNPQNQIPTPFTKAPAVLEPILDQFDPSKVYITHIDRHPPDYKKTIFTIPVLLNTSIALLLAWRAYAAAPTYLAILQTFLGYESSETVDVDHTTRGEQFSILGKRVGMILFDFLLVYILGNWPLTFFFEQPANPVTWRWNLGFQKEEVIVRVSRHWGCEDLMKGVKQGEENAFFKTRILPAIDKIYMRKTGYLMMSGSWDLDFQSMLDAHTLISSHKRMQYKDLDHLVIAHMEGIHGWVVWRWEAETDVIEHRRKKVVQFKDSLTKLGKESLFWKWTEIVEEERDRDGGFSTDGQKKVAQRVQEEFAKEGIVFDDLVASIGGLEEVDAEVAGAAT